MREKIEKLNDYYKRFSVRYSVDQQLGFHNISDLDSLGKEIHTVAYFSTIKGAPDPFAHKFNQVINFIAKEKESYYDGQKITELFDKLVKKDAYHSLKDIKKSLHEIKKIVQKIDNENSLKNLHKYYSNLAFNVLTMNVINFNLARKCFPDSEFYNKNNKYAPDSMQSELNERFTKIHSTLLESLGNNNQNLGKNVIEFLELEDKKLIKYNKAKQYWDKNYKDLKHGKLCFSEFLPIYLDKTKKLAKAVAEHHIAVQLSVSMISVIDIETLSKSEKVKIEKMIDKKLTVLER